MSPVPLYEYDGKRPTVHPTAFIAPTATLIGDVTVEAHASVWYGAVLRADVAPIVIREGANVQDNSVLHPTLDVPMVIGKHCVIGHNVMFHGDAMEERSLIGNGAVVLDGAVVSSGSVVAGQALVPAKTVVPAGRSVAGIPARERGPVEGMSALILEYNPEFYVKLARTHLETVREV